MSFTGASVHCCIAARIATQKELRAQGADPTATAAKTAELVQANERLRLQIQVVSSVFEPDGCQGLQFVLCCSRLTASSSANQLLACRTFSLRRREQLSLRDFCATCRESVWRWKQRPWPRRICAWQRRCAGQREQLLPRWRRAYHLPQYPQRERERRRWKRVLQAGGWCLLLEWFRVEQTRILR